MATVELVYDFGCPSVARAREQLLRAFARTHVAPRWREWRADDPDSPRHVRGYGSPTILVGGEDVTGEREGGACCRLYPEADGALMRVPSVEAIASALRSASAPDRERTSALKLNLTMLPGVGVALLPKLACPACWPAYAGVLSALGLGFLMDAAYLLPLTGVFLGIAVGALAVRAQRRHGWGPFAVGVVAAAIVLVGKFLLERDVALYGGLALLVGASVWNSWPRDSVLAGACAVCEPVEPVSQQQESEG